MMRRILRPTFLVLLSIFILITGCSGGAGQSSPQPVSTDPPEDEGSALLLYELSSNQEGTGFKASSDIAIPIAFSFDPGNTKGITPIKGSNLAEYYLRVAGGVGGPECYTEYTYVVEYIVEGFYNPVPKCDFDLKVIAKVLDDEVVRSGNCLGNPHEVYAAKLVFIPPTQGLQKNEYMHNYPRSQPVKTIRESGGTKITIELRNIIVPKSSGCVFAPVDTPIPSSE